MTRLVLAYMVGHTPLRPRSPVHRPPSIGPCAKIVGSNPCDSSQRAATSPPGPAPITATLLVTRELSHGSCWVRWQAYVWEKQYGRCNRWCDRGAGGVVWRYSCGSAL